MTLNKIVNRTLLPVPVLIGFIVLFACSSKKDEAADCVDPPAAQKKQVVTRENLGVTKGAGGRKAGADWCRACVFGPKGWASCQVAYAENEGENRQAVKDRARQKACDDAGFAKGKCPQEAVKAMTCKGDKPGKKSKDPAKELQKLFFPKKGDGEKNMPASPKPAPQEAKK
ncbi:MAG: hypothetical protein GY854_14390 [Deltaproteobacteria bacterium]|nr:hypothetical protein [Deltaproteobacteria bacterium]